jgi:hypothetical protein
MSDERYRPRLNRRFCSFTRTARMISSASVNPKIGVPLTFDRALLRDLVVIGSDGLLGILGALLLFASSEGLWSILLGAFRAMLPDPFHTIHAHFPATGRARPVLQHVAPDVAQMKFCLKVGGGVSSLSY